MGSLNLIHFLDFYFAFMFSPARGGVSSNISNVAQLVLSMPGRWPNLMKLVSRYHTMFWTWSTLLPACLALALVVGADAGVAVRLAAKPAPQRTA